MPEPKVTVTIPVGALEVHQRWLGEAIASVLRQTRPADEILLIDDMADLTRSVVASLVEGLPGGYTLISDVACAHYSDYVVRRETPEQEVMKEWTLRVYRTPWYSGVAHAFNYGVMLARNNLVFMLPCDDWMYPTCLEKCIDAYQRQGDDARDRTYFWVAIRYSDGQEQCTPAHHGLVSQTLWERCGGFPVEVSTGAPDAALHSILMVHPEAGRAVCVDKEPLVCHRVHAEQHTGTRTNWWGILIPLRNLVTDEWKPGGRWSRQS